MAKLFNHSIRGLDYDLWSAARQTALRQHITIGELLNRVIAGYLKNLDDQEDPGDQEDHHIAASIRDYWKQTNG